MDTRSGGTEGTKKNLERGDCERTCRAEARSAVTIGSGKSGGESARGSQSGLGRDRKVELDAGCRRMQKKGPVGPLAWDGELGPASWQVGGSGRSCGGSARDAQQWRMEPAAAARRGRGSGGQWDGRRFQDWPGC